MSNLVKELLKYFLILGGLGLILFSLFIWYSFDFASALIFLVGGVVIFSVGKAMGDVKLFFISFFGGVAIFFFTFALFFFILNTHSEDIGGSIQESIDYMLVGSLDEIIDSQFNTSSETYQIRVLLGENKSIRTIYSNNITTESSDFILENFGFNVNTMDESKKEILSKYLIGTIYESLESNPQISSDTPIPIDSIQETLSGATNLDITVLEDIDINLLELFYEENEDAYINILLFDKTEVRLIDTGDLSNEDVNLIWSNLEFPENISNETKEVIVEIALTTIAKETQESDIAGTAIPIASFSEVIPSDVKEILQYDMFSENISVRVEELQRVRDDCSENRISFDEVCDNIKLTQYDYLMSNFDNITQEANMTNLPINVSAVVSEFDTIEKVEEKFNNYTGSFIWILLFLSIIFLFVSLFIYYESLKENEHVKEYMFVFFSKLNFYNILPQFILTGFIYYFFTKENLKNFFSNFSQGTGVDISSVIVEVPLIQILFEIISDMFFIFLIYFIISLILYLGSLYIKYQVLRQDSQK